MNKNKVILISVDGMHPDGFLTCKNPYIAKTMDVAPADEWERTLVI